MAFAYRSPSGRYMAGWKDARGRQQRKTLPAAVKTLSEARRLAEGLEREAWEVAQGLKKERAPGVTLADAVEMYLAALPSDYSSRKDLEGRLRNHILPGLGPDTLVRDVKPADVMRLLTNLKRAKS